MDIGLKMGTMRMASSFAVLCLLGEKLIHIPLLLAGWRVEAKVNDNDDGESEGDDDHLANINTLSSFQSLFATSTAAAALGQLLKLHRKGRPNRPIGSFAELYAHNNGNFLPQNIV